MHWTEQAIKARLDGTFTKVFPNGRVTTVKVPLDFISDHRNKAYEAGTANLKAHAGEIGEYRHWSKAELEQVHELRAQGFTHKAIAEVLKRTISAVNHQIWVANNRAAAEVRA